MIPSMSKVFVIREDSRGNIMKQLKLSPEVADSFNSKAGKFAFTLASIYVADMNSSSHKMDQNDIGSTSYLWEPSFGPGKDILKMLQKYPHLEKSIRGKTSDVAVDTLSAVVSKKSGNLEPRADMKFPDGYFWVKLNPEECPIEGGLMQHCGSDEKGDMYSLRDKNGAPHVTLTYNNSDNRIYQVKGKQNDSPEKKYWKYVGKFVEKYKADPSESEDAPEDFMRYLSDIHSGKNHA